MKQRTLPSRIDPVPASPLFKSLQDELERVFDRFGAGFPVSNRDLWSRGDEAIMPALDIAETDKSIEITAEIPGVSEDDLDVSISDGVLTLKGEKSSDHEQKEENYHLIERRYGSFRRSITLGFTPEDDKIEASFKDGVLKLRIEKPAAAIAKTQKIKIGKG